MHKLSPHTYVLILAGGGGTRLWPQSRNKTPKQFLKLAGNQTMLQKTAHRFAEFVAWDHIFVIANKNHKSEVFEQLPQLKKENIIFEPAKKDTALAMLTGALYIGMLDKDAVIINGASDHVVVEQDKFTKVNIAAAQVATNGQYLVSVGIQPTEPSTAFGYIKVGDKIDGLVDDVNVYKVENFTEKPNEEKAKEFIATKKYYWNANNYVWTVAALQAAFDRYFPEMSELTKPLTHAKSAAEFIDQMTAIYDQAKAISIDYAISEKVTNLLLIPGDFGWNDIGEWKTVYDLSDKNEEGNVISADSDKLIAPLTMNAKNNLIHTDKRLIALLGVDDMIVVDTQDVVLVAPKSRSQDVKKLVEKLKADGREEYL